MPLFQRVAWLAGLRVWASGPAGTAHLNTSLFKNIAVSKYYGFSKYFLKLLESRIVLVVRCAGLLPAGGLLPIK